MKAAAGGRFGEVGRPSLERGPSAWCHRCAAVRRPDGPYRDAVARQERARRPLFHEPSGVHDADAVGDVGVDAHVVGDEHDRGPHLALHIADQRQHVLLHHHVERRGRLVGDDELGLTHRGQARSSPADACRRTARADRRRQDVGGRARAAEDALRHGSQNSPLGSPSGRDAKSSKVLRIRRTGLSTLIEPLHDVGEMASSGAPRPSPWAPRSGSMSPFLKW